MAASSETWRRTVRTTLLDALDDSAVWHFLAARGDAAHIVAPRSVLTRILNLSSDPKFTYSTDLAAPIPERPNLFIWDLEPSDLAKAKLSFPSRRVLGILRDVWAADMAGADVFADVAPSPSASPTVHYAIVCTPRSGSTFLCDLLHEAGIGDPREHIRPAFVELCNAGYPSAELMRWIIERGTRNGYFGTKLLAVFSPAFEDPAAGRNALEEFFREKDFRLILLSRDPAEQAISGYFAARTGVWHAQPGQAIEPAHAAVPYNWRELYREYVGYCTGDALLAQFADQFPASLRIDYRDLDADPHRMLARVADFLGVPSAAAQPPDLARMQQKISRSHDRMQQYLARFRADLVAYGVVVAPDGAPTLAASATGTEAPAKTAKMLRLEHADGDAVVLTVEEDGVVIERQETPFAYEAVALLMNEYEFDTVLDVGAGEQAHARIFRALDKEVTTLDSMYDPVFPADIRGDFLEAAINEQCDVLFCSHVLQQQRDIGAFTDRLFDVLGDGGVLALTVPPICSHWVTLSQCNSLNAGMLLYHLVMSGFDCRDARVLTYGGNASVILRKKDNGLVRRSWAAKEEVVGFLPAAIDVEAGQFNGAIHAINWVPVLDTRPHSLTGIVALDQNVPSVQQLQALVDSRRPDEAARLLEGVDLKASRGADFDYYAGVAMGTVGRIERAIDLLQRAATGGFAAFWCAYHLGIFEMKRGGIARAAYYFTVAAGLQPERHEVYSLLCQVAPGADTDFLQRVQSGSHSTAAARAAFDRGLAALQSNSIGGAVFYFTLSLMFDPHHSPAKVELSGLAPGVPLALLPPGAPPPP